MLRRHRDWTGLGIRLYFSEVMGGIQSSAYIYSMLHCSIIQRSSQAIFISGLKSHIVVITMLLFAAWHPDCFNQCFVSVTVTVLDLSLLYTHTLSYLKASVYHLYLI